MYKIGRQNTEIKFKKCELDSAKDLVKIYMDKNNLTRFIEELKWFLEAHPNQNDLMIGLTGNSIVLTEEDVNN